MKQNHLVVLGLYLTGALCAQPVRAQFNANFQTNIISGVASNWVSTVGYIIGSNTFRDVLQIINSGVLSNSTGVIGYEASGSNNAAIVSGIGSVWSNTSGLIVGLNGSGNSLTISNGGKVFSNGGTLAGANGSIKTNNAVIVNGSGSVWRNASSLIVGGDGVGHTLTIASGGAVFSDGGSVGGVTGNSNMVLVTDAGSVWSNTSALIVGSGLFTGGNSLAISNGGAVFSNGGTVGNSNTGNNNSVLVTGAGSVWSNASVLIVGGLNQSLTISNGGAVFSTGGALGGFAAGFGSGGANTVLVVGNGATWQIQSNLVVGAVGVNDQLSVGIGGELYVTNSLGSGSLIVGRLGQGTLTINGGTVTVDALVVTNNVASSIIHTNVVAFNGGLFNSRGAAVTNGLVFFDGDGTSAATYHLSGGVHSFASGLEVRNNASLTGCGTINGSVLVDAGGTVLADCGGTLTFTGSVTNNGIMRAENGSVLEAYGAVVNNGLIDIIGGSTNFHSTFINNGTVADASAFQIVRLAKEGNNIRITWSSVSGRSNVVQLSIGAAVGSYSNNFTDLSPAIVIPGVTVSSTNYLDVGGATNSPARYYRVRLVPSS